MNHNRFSRLNIFVDRLLMAEMHARGLFGKGYATVEVIDLATQRCVRQVSPGAA